MIEPSPHRRPGAAQADRGLAPTWHRQLRKHRQCLHLPFERCLNNGDGVVDGGYTTR